MARTGDNSRIAAFGVYGGAPTFAADLTEIANTASELIGEQVATTADLPSTGNWPGRTITVGDPATAVYVWATGGWVRTWSAGSPFAVAAGTGSNAAGAFGTINFPAGRFTVPPLLSFGITSTPPGIMFINSVSASSASVAGLNAAGNAIATSFHWHAVQMTPTAAAG